MVFDELLLPIAMVMQALPSPSAVDSSCLLIVVVSMLVGAGGDGLLIGGGVMFGWYV